MSLHSDLAELAIDLASDINGEIVTYNQPVDGGDDISIVIPQAIRGRALFTTTEPASAKAKVSERQQSWLVDSDLLVDGNNALIKPQRGATITDESSRVYRVMPLTKDGPLWEYVDQEGRTKIRIYTAERS